MQQARPSGGFFVILKFVTGGYMSKNQDFVLEFYETTFDKKVLDKIVLVPENERFKDGFKEPTGYYFIDGFNCAVFIRTIKRAIAIELEKKMYGGKFTVRKVIKAEVR